MNGEARKGCLFWLREGKQKEFLPCGGLKTRQSLEEDEKTPKRPGNSSDSAEFTRLRQFLL